VLKEDPMSLPPDELPDGLSAREYRRLGIKYLLMGKNDHATEAFTLGYEEPAESTNGESSGAAEETRRSYQQGARFGANLTNAVMKLLQHQAASHNDDNEGNNNANSQQYLDDIREQLGALGVPEDKVAKFIEELVEVVTVAGTEEPPPRVVPTDLTPREFYELGVHYKELGWTEQARDALIYAIEGDQSGDWGIKAKNFMQARLPRFPVPFLAEQRNITGYNLMMSGDLAGAKETFEALIEEYPDFEWPHGNLGFLYLGEGNILKAQKILEKALTLNPNYLNGWLHLARVRALSEDFKGAYECLEKAAVILPDNADAEKLCEFIKELETGERSTD
jgi:tetratricopeptide (TPR) repeat protein